VKPKDLAEVPSVVILLQIGNRTASELQANRSYVAREAKVNEMLPLGNVVQCGAVTLSQKFSFGNKPTLGSSEATKAPVL
jgi:hypothetical protein